MGLGDIRKETFPYVLEGTTSDRGVRPDPGRTVLEVGNQGPVPSSDRDGPRAKTPVDEILKTPDLVLAEEFDVYSAAGHIPEGLEELLRAITQVEGL
jgi:hypothetical protein